MTKGREERKEGMQRWREEKGRKEGKVPCRPGGKRRREKVEEEKKEEGEESRQMERKYIEERKDEKE